MMLFNKILVPTDGSENTNPAISQALRLAKFTGAEVTAICINDQSNYASTTDVVPDLDSHLYQASVAAVRKVVEQGKNIGVEVTPLVINGIPAREIIDASREYDLIVMGTIGRTGLAHLLLGSVAEKVIRFASCPVLVIHGAVDNQPDGLSFHRILIPTDGSNNTKPAVALGLTLAKTFQAEVIALSVSDVKNVPASAGEADKADRYLNEVSQDAVSYVVNEGRKLGLMVRTMVISGSPANEIINHSGNYDLIIMGTMGRTGFAYLRLGSVAEKTVRHSRCPVLVVGARTTAISTR
jgi:nucleotide-binding universal stress UspA family protein